MFRWLVIWINIALSRNSTSRGQSSYGNFKKSLRCIDLILTSYKLIKAMLRHTGGADGSLKALDSIMIPAVTALALG